MLKVLSGMYSEAGKVWCKMMHPDPMWPVKGKYICPACQRAYPVPWESKEEVEVAPHPELVTMPTRTGNQYAA